MRCREHLAPCPPPPRRRSSPGRCGARPLAVGRRPQRRWRGGARRGVGTCSPGGPALAFAAHCRAEAAPMRRAARRAARRRRCRVAAGAPEDQPPPPHLRMSAIASPPLGAAAALLSSRAPTAAAAATARATGAISEGARGRRSGAGRRNGGSQARECTERLRGPEALYRRILVAASARRPLAICDGTREAPPAAMRLRGCAAPRKPWPRAMQATKRCTAEQMRAVMCTHNECVPEAPPPVIARLLQQSSLYVYSRLRYGAALPPYITAHAPPSALISSSSRRSRCASDGAASSA